MYIHVYVHLPNDGSTIIQTSMPSHLVDLEKLRIQLELEPKTFLITSQILLPLSHWIRC